jgi:hypothetical protein
MQILLETCRRKWVLDTRVAKAGKSKIALVMPKEYLQFVKDELDILVPTRYFGEKSEAVAWLVEHQ